MPKIFRRRRGDVLLPERFTPTVIQALRSKPREFDGQYQQEPIPSGGVIFDPSWWKYYKTKELPECELIVLSVDCAFKSAKQNDYVSIQKWGSVGARAYLLDCFTEHLGFAATKAHIRAMQQEGRPASAILIEDRANGSAIIEELRADPDFGAAVIAIEPEGGKESRAHAASTDAEAGNVYLPEDAPWLGPLLRSLTAFPGARHDDDVDALTQFLNWRRTRNLSYGVLDWTKKVAREIAEGLRDAAGNLLHPKTKPQPVRPRVVEGPVQVEGFERWKREGRAPACPACGSSATIFIAGPKVLCNQCTAIDGVVPRRETTCGCSNPLVVMAGGHRHCNSCGWDEPRPSTEASNGATFRQLQGRRFHGGFAIRGPFGG